MGYICNIRLSGYCWAKRSQSGNWKDNKYIQQSSSTYIMEYIYIKVVNELFSRANNTGSYSLIHRNTIRGSQTSSWPAGITQFTASVHTTIVNTPAIPHSEVTASPVFLEVQKISLVVTNDTLGFQRFVHFFLWKVAIPFEWKARRATAYRQSCAVTKANFTSKPSP